MNDAWQGTMSGGRRKFDEELARRLPPPLLPPPTAEQRATAGVLEDYKLMMAFRRRVNAALRALRVSFAEWRVIEATWRLTRRSGEPVSHLEVSRDLQLDEGSVSRLMRRLMWRSIVSHDLDALNVCYRVCVTERGDEIVAAAYPLVARLLGSRLRN